MTFNNQLIGNAPAASFTAASDTVAGVQFQRVKLVGGAENSLESIEGTAANGLEVDVTRVQGTVTVTGSVTVSDGSGPLTVDGTVAATQSGVWSVDTEIAAAVALNDGVGNYTTGTAGAANLIFNGTTWDRARGDITNGIDVDVTRVQGTVTVDNAELPAAAALADATANPSTTVAAAATLVFNGTTWDRCRGDITNGMDVDVTRLPTSATATRSTVAASATSVTLLAANTARRGATIANDSTAILYVGLGTVAASLTNYTILLNQNDYYEVPYNYTGQIVGIWASATGNARITELT